jgi:hypothetical protein
MPAPASFNESQSIGAIAPSFARRAGDFTYWLISDGDRRLPAVFIGDADASAPAAAVVPLDADFGTRVAASLRLWRLTTVRPRARAAERLTPHRRHRLVLTLRALDARLTNASYRVIAQTLFGHTRIPAGAAWKTHDLRDRTIRLARSGLKLMQGGYRDLLRYPRRG